MPAATVAPSPALLPSAGDNVTLHSTDDALARRQALIQFLWGTDGFPSAKLPTSVDLNVQSPVTGLSNVGRVDELHFQMDQGVESFAYHFIPLSGAQGRAVILHQGHSPVLDDDHSLADISMGMQRTIANLLEEGYAVLAMYMPGCLPPADTCTIPHEQIVELPTVGNGIKFFLEPVARSLNYLATQSATDGFPPYDDFAMVGLSGGGWTTTVYAALDPRITLSIPIAGSLPLPMRNAVGDEEQTLPAFYAIADYPDLYAMGGLGTGRRQVQVLNRYDNCCFGESPSQYSDEGTGQSFDTAVRGYEVAVRKALAEMGSGAFELEIDEAAPGHMISWNTIGSIILTELRSGGQAPRSAAIQVVATTEGFIRSPRGTLARVDDLGLVEDTAIPIVGLPTWARVGQDGYEVFARDPVNRLVHAVKSGGAWLVNSFGTVILTNPTMAQPTDVNRVDLAALSTAYVPNHWWGIDAAWSSDNVAGAPKTLGPPHLRHGTQGQLELVARDLTHAVFRFEADPADVWTAITASATRTSVSGH